MRFLTGRNLIMNTVRNFNWRHAVEEAASRWKSPFFLVAWGPVRAALGELALLETAVPVRHWLSLKTQPVGKLVRAWQQQGLGVEIVTEYEFRAAVACGFDAQSILVNGVAKHVWLSQVKTPGLRVHFDSLHEVEQLAPQARALGWRIGLRLDVRGAFDESASEFQRQFGLSEDEVRKAKSILDQAGVRIEGLHFHLKSNLGSVKYYSKALHELERICRSASLEPQYLDLGGGFPAPGETASGVNNAAAFDLEELANMLRDARAVFPGLAEIWFENGRFMTARAGALVITVLDIKERPDSRYLICDGGRTNHAFVSMWQEHEVLTIPERNGGLRPTTICGSTCTGFDRLGKQMLPGDIRIGDQLAWLNAGAYHIPWETRFSHGLAAVIWQDEQGRLSLAREAEDFNSWWSQWK
jgi:diaminopimelate decarboxylase